MFDRPLSLIEVLVAEYQQQQKMSGGRLPDLPAPYTDQGIKEAFARIEGEAERLFKDSPDEQCEYVSREADNLVKGFYRAVPAGKRAALCFSGGGIRSATFVLGLLQGLARHGVKLEDFDYVSTVSGGGYIGSWLSAWIHRQGIKRVQEDLARSAPKHRLLAGETAWDALDEITPSDPEPEPVQHLRRYSNYMSPKLGLLSADTWSLVAIFLRNLLLNWSVLIPLLTVVLAIPRLGMAAVTWDWSQMPHWVPPALFGGSLLLGIIGVAFIVLNRPSLFAPPLRESARSQWLRSDAGFELFCLAPLLLSAIAAASFWAWNQQAGGARVTFAPVFNFLRPWRSYVPDSLVRLSSDAMFDFVTFGVVFHIGGFLLFCLIAYWSPNIRHQLIGWWDFLYTLVTGAVGGFGLWFIAYKVLWLEPGAALSATGAALYVSFAASLFLMMILLAATLFVGLMSYFTNDADREWLARAGGWVLIAIVVWCAGSAIVIYGPSLVLYVGLMAKASLLSLGAGSGVVTLVGGFSEKSAAMARGGGEKKKSSGLLKVLLPLAATLFAVFIMVLLSLGVSLLINAIWPAAPAPGIDLHLNVLHQAHPREVMLLSLVIALMGLVMGYFINVNKFSLHAAYRDRLIRAYLGASRRSAERRPNPFTGLDESDNLQMHQLLTELFYPESFAGHDLSLLLAQLSAEGEVTNFISEKLGGDWPPKGYQPSGENPTPEQQLKDYEFRCQLADGLNQIIQRWRLQYELKELLKEPLKEPSYKLVNDLLAVQPVVPWVNQRVDDWLSRKRWLAWLGPVKGRVSQKVTVEWLRMNRLILELTYSELPQLEMRRTATQLAAPLPLSPEVAPSRRPLHVVNITLNLVAGKELAWQERKAQPFTVSPLHAGSFGLGYRPATHYAINRKAAGALSLGTSLAISGAAVSPNMGYNSSPAVTFLLSLFNVRLGWWLGNPGPAGEGTYKQPGPVFAPQPLLAETFGNTDAEHPYVYLSDGAHFENLALYEMVRRRCRFIIVSDAGADGDFDFGDLGNALRKIRIDLGVPIDFEGTIPIRVRETPETLLAPKDEDFMKSRRYCASAVIRYSAVDGGKPEDVDGKLIYIKPTVYGGEPPDVLNYAKDPAAFPHETTGDQMYSESQFESYRALGAYVIDQITEEATVGSVEELFNRVGNYLEGKQAELHQVQPAAAGELPKGEK